jgi:hypothetical protein
LLITPAKEFFPLILSILIIDSSPALIILSFTFSKYALFTVTIDPEKSIASLFMSAKLTFFISPSLKSISIASENIFLYFTS